MEAHNRALRLSPKKGFQLVEFFKWERDGYYLFLNFRNFVFGEMIWKFIERGWVLHYYCLHLHLLLIFALSRSN